MSGIQAADNTPSMEEQFGEIDMSSNGPASMREASKFTADGKPAMPIDRNACQSKSHRWSQYDAGVRHCKDCGQIDAYRVIADPAMPIEELKPLQRLDIEVAIGAAVRYANRTIKPATDQPIASCCEGAAAEIVLDALEATGFAIVRAPVHPTPTAAGPPIEAFSEYGQYSPITVGTGTATAADTPACFENHHKYVGKCPYCHTELPPAADTGLVERLTDAEKDAHFWKANYNGFKAMAEAAEQREAAAREQMKHHSDLRKQYLAEADAAREQIAALERALEPFADFASLSSFDKLPDLTPMTAGSGMAARQVTAGDFKRARAALTIAGETQP